MVINRQAIRVVIADDHLGVRSALRKFLERAGDIWVVGEASDGKEAVEQVKAQDPDLLILDLEMPVMGGIEALAELQRTGCHVPVLILSANDGKDYASIQADLGASGYLMKEEAPGLMIGLIRELARRNRPGMILNTEQTPVDT